jgi:hypothetical protein
MAIEKGRPPEMLLLEERLRLRAGRALNDMLGIRIRDANEDTRWMIDNGSLISLY